MFEGKEFRREADEDLPRWRYGPRDGESLGEGTTHTGISFANVNRAKESEALYEVDGVRYELQGAVQKEPVDPVTVFDRLVAAGLSHPRAEWHLGAGRVTLDGRLVTDPYCLAPSGTRLVVDVQ
jgi:hypothetical protein